MLNDALHKLFRKLGFEIRRLSSSKNQTERARVTMTEGMRHLRDRDFVPRTIIDVGAAYGTKPLLEVFPEAHYLWLEPLREYEPKLEKLRSKYDGEIILAAAGSRQGKATISIDDGLQGSSVKDDGSYGPKPTREIDVIPLNHLKDKIDVQGDLLLKADVQGAELDVLDGASEILPSVDVIILEVSFFRFFDGVPLFDEVVAYMKERNFTVYDILDGITRPRDHALGQKDIVFVQTDGRFRESQSWL